MTIMSTVDLPTIARKLRDLETEVAEFRHAVEHAHKWDRAIEDMGPASRPKSAVAREVLGNTAMLETEPGQFVFHDYDAACVEQVELFLADNGNGYVVRLRFDDDTTERLGDFGQHASAYDYAREQARRYHIALFDSTYEDLVD